MSSSRDFGGVVRTLRALTPSLIVAAAVAFAAPAQAQVTYLTATINAAQEVPPNPSTATGFGSFWLDTAANTLTYHIEFSGLSTAETAAHIHGFSLPGVNSGIIFPLALGSPKTGLVALSAAQETNILAGLTYVNVHSTAFPGGEIRGQIGVGPTEYFLTTSLSGANEVPPNGSAGTGGGCLVLDTASGMLSYNIAFVGLSAAETAAHFHGFAAPGSNAGVLIALPLGSPKVGTASLTLAQIHKVSIGLAYVNVHSTIFPGGELRGQLVQPPAHVAFCFGDGSVANCPCGNNAVLGSQRGCLNSLGLGARLAASGFASLACETLSLAGSDMFSGTAIYLQGDAVVAAPVPFGDGLRCAGGSLKRLAVVTNVGGASQIPVGGGPLISVAGGILAPGSFAYQCYYRDPDLAHCPPNTFNVTHAVAVTWLP